HAAPTASAAQIVDVDAQPLAVADALGWHLLVERQHTLQLTQVQDPGVASRTLVTLAAHDGAHHHVIQAILEGLEDVLLLGLADALEDDLLCGLRRNLVEDLRRVHLHGLAQRGVWVDQLGLAQRDLLQRMLWLRHHALVRPDVDIAAARHLDANVLASAGGLAIRGEEGIGDSFHHHILWQALLVNELGDRRLKLGLHVPSSSRRSGRRIAAHVWRTRQRREVTPRLPRSPPSWC